MSRFDRQALAAFGFGSFTEAFNTLGHCTGNKPASIKNYRDEFDPYFDNPRRGWHKRGLRDFCRAHLDACGSLDMPQFIDLVKDLAYQEPDIDRLNEETASSDHAGTGYVNRLLTGQAAERYFVENFSEISEFSEFSGCSMVDMTRSGCGFDFKLERAEQRDYLAVEVKGLARNRGAVLFTDKEWWVADRLGERYFVYVVKNFAAIPCATLYRGPIAAQLHAVRKEVMEPRVTWQAAV